MSKKPLNDEQKEAINDLMHALRYEFEGPRDIDSIEEWVDDWVERKA